MDGVVDPDTYLLTYIVSSQADLCELASQPGIFIYRG